MTEYRLYIVIAALAAVVVWGANAALLLEMTRVGEINPFVFLLFFAGVVALLVAAWRVHRGKKARISFALHILFAVGAVAMNGFFFYPRLPLTLSLAVAIAALLLSFISRSAAPTVTGATK
jgi:hypothetical protein